MSVKHYENFPVASLMVPKAQRRAVELIYAFARSADDLADEGDAPAEMRLKALDRYLTELDRIEQKQTPESPLFQELAGIVAQHELPLDLFRSLIFAFKQDVTVKGYQNFNQLLNYCQHSANPVGRLMLHLFKAVTPLNLKRSDNVCTALQLINFWQDIDVDWKKNRVYLPQDELSLYHVSEQQIADRQWNDNFAALVDFQIDRSRQIMLSGASLAQDLPGRFGWEIRLTVLGGLRILEKLRQVRGNVFANRPTLGLSDWVLLGWRSLNY